MATTKKKNHYYVLVFTNEGPRYVTKVNYSNKTAEWNLDEKPLEFDRESAHDLCLGLNLNFNLSVVVEQRWEIDSNPYRYDVGEFEWKFKEDDENGSEDDN